MGVCSSKLANTDCITLNPQATAESSVYQNESGTYPQKHVLKLKYSPFDPDRTNCEQFLNFELTPPVKDDSLKASDNTYAYKASLSVHRNQPVLTTMDCSTKPCQDDCGFFSDKHKILLVLFDGHGPKGHDVAKFCVRFAGMWFKKQNVDNEPEHYVQRLIQQCDKALESRTDIDQERSGCTGVAVLVYKGYVYSASVGDSRAIAAATSSDVAVLFPEPQLSESGRGFDLSSLGKRVYEPKKAMSVIQLTKDQIPEDKQEAERIRAAGGMVAQLYLDGEAKGPIRVMKRNEAIPGLAMTRTIGDRLGKSIGVTSEPLTSTCCIESNGIQYIVLGSDGLWDAMSNQDVANFVDQFATNCKAESFRNPRDKVVGTNCLTVAQLLAEEARLRWLRHLEQ